MNVFDIEGQWPLDDVAVIRLQGADAAPFLHSQLSNAVLDLTGDQARPAGYCTAQGRLLANMVVWKDGDQGIGMLVSRDLADPLIKRLRLFVLRAKVSLARDEGCSVTGAQGRDTVPEPLWGRPGWSCLTRGDDTWITAPRAGGQPPAAWRIGPGAPAGSVAATPWHAAQIASGWPWIRLASQDMFLPATLNMDLNGSIDFKKGCYPGQEIVARSHYRGVVKRRMAWGTAPWPPGRPLPEAGTDLYSAAGRAARAAADGPVSTALGQPPARPVGRIIASAEFEGRLYAAAETAVADGPAAVYAVGAADGPLLSCACASAGGVS
ncbi:YgfZ/GcvT domain-containing protein [Castellaniella hirudinis]|uniref:CAF17-like 4Fe-4S cluster assembly/insertion protein YgfZ n=1 Tax=Castellaniella hirudinis TaxID=1144617 RepID=UPI0039C07533